MFDPDKWAELLKAEWAVIKDTPFNFAAAMLVGWLLIWAFQKAWNARRFSNAKSNVDTAHAKLALVERQLEIEKSQKEGLRKALEEQGTKVPVLALEIRYGDPEIRKVVKDLAEGKPITVIGDPAQPAPQVTSDLANINRLAALSYTAANGISQSVSSTAGSTESTGTLVARNILVYIDK